MKHRFLTVSIGIITLALLSFQLGAQPQRPQSNEGWNYSLGVGSMIKPKYKGSQDYDFWPIPYFDVKYGDLFYLSPARGAGFQFKAETGIDYAIGLGFDFGRDEEDGDLLEGMGEIDFGLLAKVEAGYTIGDVRLGLALAQEITDVHGGYVLEASVSKRFLLREWKSVLNLQAFATYASEDYLTTYFGVDREQSLNTAYAEFAPESEVSELGLSGTWIRPINQKWSFLAMLRYTRLVGDSADSPVIESENQFFGGVFFVRQM